LKGAPPDRRVVSINNLNKTALLEIPCAITICSDTDSSKYYIYSHNIKDVEFQGDRKFNGEKGPTQYIEPVFLVERKDFRAPQIPDNFRYTDHFRGPQNLLLAIRL
jgi:hypothetical protein